MPRNESPRPVPLTILGPVTHDSIQPLCDAVTRRVRDHDADEVICDVDGLGTPDAVALDALARLQMTARRLGACIRLENPCPRLRDLLHLTGLDTALPVLPAVPVTGGSGVEGGRQAEVGEEGAVEVEEVVDRGDPPV